MELFKILGTVAIDNQDAIDGIDDTIDKAEKAHPKIKTAFDKIGDAAVKVGKAAAAGLAAVSSGIIAIGTYATTVGSEFEAQMSKVEAISGATGEKMEALTAKAKQLGKDTKFSATEAGKAFEYMAMAGWSVEQMLDGVAGVMDLAAASGEDLALTSDIVTDALTAFGLEAKESTRFANVLAQASSNANTNVALMGETFKYVAPVAGALGFSIEDVSVAIGLMANAGIKGSEAGTALRAMLSRLVSPTKDSADAMALLGLNITNSDGTMRGFSEIVVDLRNGFSKLTEAEQAQIAAELAGQEAMSGLLAIVNASEEEFQKLTVAVNDAEGAAKRMADTMMNNLSGKITLLKSSLEGFGIALYESVQVPLMEAASWGIEAVNKLTTAMNEEGVSGVVAAVGNIFANAATEIANRLPIFIELAVSVISSFVSGIQDNGEQIVDAAINMCNTLIQAISRMLPEILILGMDLLLTFVNGIVENLDELADSALNMIWTIAEGIIEYLPQLTEASIKLIEKLAELLTEEETLTLLLDASFAIILAIGSALIGAAPELLTAAIKITEKLIEFLLEEDNLEKFVNAAVTLITQLARGLVENLDVLVEGAAKIASTIVTGIFETNWAAVGLSIIDGICGGLLGGNLWGKVSDALGLDGGGVNTAPGAGRGGAPTTTTPTITTTTTTTKPETNEPVRTGGGGSTTAGSGAGNTGGGGSASASSGAGRGGSTTTTTPTTNTKPTTTTKPTTSTTTTTTTTVATTRPKDLTKPSIKMAKGGVLEKGQLGFLEGDGAEAVVPLDQNEKWISAVARDMLSAGVNSNVDSEMLRQIIVLLETLINTLPDTMIDAFATMKFDVNNREFARLVKAVN